MYILNLTTGVVGLFGLFSFLFLSFLFFSFLVLVLGDVGRKEEVDLNSIYEGMRD